MSQCRLCLPHTRVCCVWCIMPHIKKCAETVTMSAVSALYSTRVCCVWCICYIQKSVLRLSQCPLWLPYARVCCVDHKIGCACHKWKNCALSAMLTKVWCVFKNIYCLRYPLYLKMVFVCHVLKYGMCATKSAVSVAYAKVSFVCHIQIFSVSTAKSAILSKIQKVCCEVQCRPQTVSVIFENVRFSATYLYCSCHKTWCVCHT
jgi:hypothetical protein